MDFSFELNDMDSLSCPGILKSKIMNGLKGRDSSKYTLYLDLYIASLTE
jgi:hypothetical protein